MHAWERSEGSAKLRIWRLLNIATLLIAAVAVFLALKKPAPVAQLQPAAALSTNAQAFQAKVDQLAQTPAQGQTAEVRLTGEEVAAAFAQAAVPLPPPESKVDSRIQQTSSAQPAELSAPAAPDNIDINSLGEPIVSFEDDKVIGQFVTDVAGKKVYITVAGHLGAKDGYVTFDPTEFKFGDLNIPVSLVRNALQKKMLEQRDRLKLPDFIDDLRVQNGQLVLTRK